MIREAVPADSKQIADVHINSWRIGYRGIISEEILSKLDKKEREERWVSILNSGALPCLVAERTENIVGFAHIAACRDSDLDSNVTGEVTALYISPSCWRQGIGSELMVAALDYLKGMKFTESSLWVLESNTQGRNFYEKHQFGHDGITKFDKRLGLTELRYRRRL